MSLSNTSINGEIYEVTINRADHVMVRRTGADWFEIAPETLVEFILFGLRSGLLRHRTITDRILEIVSVENKRSENVSK